MVMYEKKEELLFRLTNPKSATVIPKGTPIGQVFPVTKEDLALQEVPSIASMSQNFSNCPFYNADCVCKMNH